MTRQIFRLAILPLLALAPLPAVAQAGPPSALSWRIPGMAPPSAISADEFATRRRALADSLGNGVYVFFGERSPAADYMPWQQNPDFRYLTGIEEPDAALIMVRAAGRLEERLFVPPRNPSREVWEGARLGPSGARALTRIPAEDNTRVMPVLDSLLASATVLFAATEPVVDPPGDRNLSFDEQALGRIHGRFADLEIRPAASALRSLRAKKSDTELDRIRRAVYVTAEAHRQAMMAAEPRMNEFEIRAIVEYFFLRNGGDGPSYASIVGSGPNSTTLHYNADDRCMNDGEVLLFDVAAYYAGYAADVTRTIPVNGRFSAAQRDIYQIVLAAQKAAEQQIRPGAKWADLNGAANAEIASGLVMLGLIDAPDATYDCGAGASARKCPQYRLFYLHGLGHGVGLEVHDPDISTSAGFQPGSAVTIEPGVYVRSDALDYLPDTPSNREMISRLRPVIGKYAGTGVRIEDVYIMDANGVERASRGAPREIDEIEALMRESAPAASDRRADVVAWRCPAVRT